MIAKINSAMAGISVGFAFAFAMSVACAQPAPVQVMRVWPGPPPEVAGWPRREVVRHLVARDGRATTVYADVSDPTLTVVRPMQGRANGAAVIVMPGGSFMELAWDKEGLVPAHWLADRGVVALVLKYRVRAIKFPSDAELGPQPGAFEKAMKVLDPNLRVAIADARQAVRTVRASARALGVSRHRIGLMGFSAGATTTMDTLLEADPASRPDFAVAVYGAMEGLRPPRDAPPIFIAAAQDDDIVPVQKSIDIFEAWETENRSAELHIYQSGGHGFGMGRPGSATAGWPRALEGWLRGNILSPTRSITDSNR